MVQHFSHLQNHTRYVLHLYRNCFRLIKVNLHSSSLQNTLKNELRRVAHKNQNNVSSWKVYIVLKKLQELNGYLFERNLEKITTILNEITLEKSKTKEHHTKSLKIVRELKEAQLADKSHKQRNHQDTETVRNMFILDRYVKRLQSVHQLPKVIPKDLKRKLLMPLAIHEHAVLKLNIVHNQLAKGPPPVYLTNTIFGKSQIWFIRSAFNKGKRQSKRLTALFMSERIQHQKHIDFINSSGKLLQMAIYEGIWEYYIQTGIILNININALSSNLFTQLRQALVKHDTALNYVTKALSYQGSGATNLALWVLPVFESLYYLQRKEQNSIKRYNIFKIKLQEPSNLRVNMFKKKSQLLYEIKMLRYKNVVSSLPSVNKFSSTNNLQKIMKDNRLWPN